MKYDLQRRIVRRAASPDWGPTIDDVFENLETKEHQIATNAMNVFNHAKTASILARIPIPEINDILLNVFMSGICIGAALSQDGEFAKACREKFESEDQAGMNKVMDFREVVARMKKGSHPHE